MLEIRDVLTFLALMVTAASVILVSRNARRATAVQAQNTDLTRIRDLRAETRELKDEIASVREQLGEMAGLLTAANERAMGYARREVEMIQYAHMPGVTIEDFRKRYGTDQSELRS